MKKPKIELWQILLILSMFGFIIAALTSCATAVPVMPVAVVTPTVTRVLEPIEQGIAEEIPDMCEMVSSGDGFPPRFALYRCVDKEYRVVIYVAQYSEGLSIVGLEAH